MRKYLIGLMVIVGLGLSGCAINTGNENITKKENTKKLRVYKSTQSQVKNMLGEPNSVMMLDGGKERWTYQHTGGDFALFGYLGAIVGKNRTNLKTRMTILSLVFNSRGILVRKKFGY